MKSEETHDKQAGLPTATTDLLRILTDRIVQNFQPIRLILFGSYARGEANPHSDIDLLVVFPQASDKRQSRYVARSPTCLCVKMSSSQLQKGLLTTSPLITSWQVLIADEAARRAIYKVRCQLLRPAYRLEIRLIQTEADLLYSYQLFTDYPILRWDNAPHCPSLRCFPHHQHEEN